MRMRKEIRAAPRPMLTPAATATERCDEVGAAGEVAAGIAVAFVGAGRIVVVVVKLLGWFAPEFGPLGMMTVVVTTLRAEVDLTGVEVDLAEVEVDLAEVEVDLCCVVESEVDAGIARPMDEPSPTNNAFLLSLQQVPLPSVSQHQLPTALSLTEH